MRRITLVIAVLALAIAAPAVADKGGNPHGGGGGNGSAGSGNDSGGGPGYSGTLNATPDMLHSGDLFDVSGCGYDTSLGNVIVGFTGGSWGSSLDSNGCFTISRIPALSGDVLPPGTYSVIAYQYVHNKWAETGETTVTVVA